ncbi:MAG: diversity-generating retroelement protein Avd [Nitrospirota bacterium]
MPELPPIVTKAYDFTQWLLPRVQDFPRSSRFILGDRLIATMLDILEGLVEASHRRDKRAVLEEVSAKLDRLRMLIRLSKDLKLLNLKRYEHAAEAVTELGAMLGGWLKQQRDHVGSLYDTPRPTV